MKPESLRRLRDVLDTPCSLRRWEQMEGDERSRSCDGCGQTVQNLEVLDEAQADAVLADEAACVRFRVTPAGRLLLATGTVLLLAACGPRASGPASLPDCSGGAVNSESIPGSGRVEVLVVDGLDLAVPGVRVLVRDRWGNSLGQSQTDADGRSEQREMPLGEGLALEVEHGAFCPIEEPFSLSANEGVRLHVRLFPPRPGVVVG